MSEDFGAGLFDEPDQLGRYTIDPDCCGEDEGDPYDYPAELDDDDYGEPIGCCDECESNLYEADCWEVDGLQLCGHCAWVAMGCPSPGDTADDD